jgi:hypothetical protein
MDEHPEPCVLIPFPRGEALGGNVTPLRERGPRLAGEHGQRQGTDGGGGRQESQPGEHGGTARRPGHGTASARKRERVGAEYIRQTLRVKPVWVPDP